MTLDEARARFEGGAMLANLPASAMGGGALKTGFGGPGGGVASREGDGLAEELRLIADASAFVLRAGGGAGGGPRLEDCEVPVV